MIWYLSGWDIGELAEGMDAEFYGSCNYKNKHETNATLQFLVKQKTNRNGAGKALKICRFVKKRACYHETKIRRLVFLPLQNKYATLQKPEDSLWHTQGLHITSLGAETIIFMLGIERGQHGAIRGHGAGGYLRINISF